MQFAKALPPKLDPLPAFFGVPEDGAFVTVNLLEFKTVAASPECREIERHRSAALEGQLNIRTKPMGGV